MTTTIQPDTGTTTGATRAIDANAARASEADTASTVNLTLGEEAHLRDLARRLARCEADADDLVQGTLLRAYGARARFLPGSSIRAWTTTILRRLFLTGAIRAKWRGLQTDTDAGGPLEWTPGRDLREDADPADGLHVISDLLDDDVKRALEHIPEVYRTAFLLSVVREMTCAEIATRLSIPESTVMSRVHRARERLRTGLAHRRNPTRAARDPLRP